MMRRDEIARLIGYTYSVHIDGAWYIAAYPGIASDEQGRALNASGQPIRVGGNQFIEEHYTRQSDAATIKREHALAVIRAQCSGW